MVIDKKVWVGLALVVIGVGCFFNRTKGGGGAKGTFFIQVPLDIPILLKMQKELTPQINEVIKAELAGIELDKDVPIFFFKKRQAVTTYYVNDMCEDGQSYLFSAFDTIVGERNFKSLALIPKLDFFGEPKVDRMALVDLVAHIEDVDGMLEALNKEAKDAVAQANQEYLNKYHADFYDRAKSEKYPFAPHITLGHLRVNYIKYVMQDDAKAEVITERIKQSILKIVLDALLEVPAADRAILFDKICIYDLQKRAYIREHSL